jgi:hypothetical protein
MDLKKRIPLLTVLIVLASLAPLSVRAAARKPGPTQYTPPASPGDIYVILDYARVRGAAQTTSIDATLDGRHRSLTVGEPYADCETSSPAGIVFRMRHYTSDTTPFTLTTSGTVVRPPYQGGVPIEATHRCYRLVS